MSAPRKRSIWKVFSVDGAAETAADTSVDTVRGQKRTIVPGDVALLTPEPGMQRGRFASLPAWHNASPCEKTR